jgi:hypothetical protein
VVVSSIAVSESLPQAESTSAVAIATAVNAAGRKTFIRISSNWWIGLGRIGLTFMKKPRFTLRRQQLEKSPLGNNFSEYSQSLNEINEMFTSLSEFERHN